MLFTGLPGLSRRLRAWAAGVPSQCAVCHAWPAQRVCAACVARFAAPAIRCQRCALRVPSGVLVCGACLHNPPVFDACLAALDYAYPWADALADFKFRADPGWAGTLSTLLRAAPGVASAIAAADRVLPVPLSAQRLRERGFNQSVLLAQPLAGAKTDVRTLLRRHATEAQSGLPRAQRLRNLRGAFALAPPLAAALRGQRLVLLDDVMTTSATVPPATPAPPPPPRGPAGAARGRRGPCHGGRAGTHGRQSTGGQCAGVAGWEAISQSLRGGTKQRLIGSDRNELEALFDIAARIGFDRREDADGFAGSTAARMDVGNGRLHLPVVGVAEMPQGRRQVGRADEDAIDPPHLQNALQRLDAGTGFDLQQHANVVMYLARVLGLRAVAVAALRVRDATDAQRRIARGGHRRLRRFGRFDERQQQVDETDVQQPL